jgi:hypothetical protein
MGHLVPRPVLVPASESIHDTCDDTQDREGDADAVACHISRSICR